MSAVDDRPHRPAPGPDLGPRPVGPERGGVDATLAELEVLRCTLRGEDPARARSGKEAARSGLTAPTGLDAVQAACGLSTFERSLLLLACGPSLVGAVAGELAAGTGVPHLTFGAALAVLGDAHWSATAPTSGLRRWLLLWPEDPTRVLTSRLVVDERILHLVAGLEVLDERIEHASGERAAARLPTAWAEAAERLAGTWVSGPVQLIGVGGRDAAGIAAVAAERCGRSLRQLSGADLPTVPAELWTFARLLEREVRLGSSAFWIDLTAAADEQADRIGRALAAVPLVACTGGTADVLVVPKPDHRERAGNLEARIRPADGARLTWDDLVLPQAQLDQIRALGAAARHRGLVLDDWGFAARLRRGIGTSALFVGPSGTGKTFAAEVLTAELGRRLVQVDLSQVVSKYIGETEKHLARHFDAAEQDGHVLFFDEADALFGRRTAVKDSHDRYANIEVSYLLQRLESFSGLALLASNARAALDTAFLRRLTAVVVFPHPDAGARLELWRRAFPEAMPRGELDLRALAHVDATGATIMSAALSAAYLAADAGQAVSTAHVLRALDWELAKAGRPAHGVPDSGGAVREPR